jgi:hypothetical protein
MRIEITAARGALARHAPNDAYAGLRAADNGCPPQSPDAETRI